MNESLIIKTRKALTAKKYSERTIETYLLWVRRFTEFFPNKMPENLTSSNLTEFLSFLIKRKRASKSTARQAYSSIISVYDLVFEKELNPTINFDWQKSDAPEIFTISELKLFFESIDSFRYRIIYQTLYSAGLDVNEFRRIKITDLDFKNDQMIIQPNRNKPKRYAPLSKYLKSEIFDYLEMYSPKKYLVENKSTHAPLSDSSIQRNFNKYLEDSEVEKDLTLRSLKYSYVKHLETLGVPLWDIMHELDLKSQHLLYSMSKIGATEEGVKVSPLDYLYRDSITGTASKKQNYQVIWDMLHPHVVKISKSRFETGHYADAVTAAFKELETRVIEYSKNTKAAGYSGADLMNRIFSGDNPILQLNQMNTISEKDEQKGFHLIFSGSMTGVRNPISHVNKDISPEQSIHLLMLVSLLMLKLDNVIKKIAT